jgi:hypothetical protein
MPISFDSEDEIIEAAQRLERARYWSHLRALANQILDDAPDDDDHQQDLLHELADSAVLYTKDAIEAIRFTEHDDALFDDVGELADVGSAADVYTQIAYFAVRQDLADELARQRDERGTNPRYGDTEINTWFERDRSHVELRNRLTDETIVEWWDEDVTQAVDDGFLNPNDWHASAYRYAVDTKLISPTEDD